MYSHIDAHFRRYLARNSGTADPLSVEVKRKRLSRSYALVSDKRLRHTSSHAQKTIGSRLRTLSQLLERQFLSHYFGVPPKWRSALRALGGKRTLPDFCVIGSIKSGTSDLAVNVMLHPNVIPPIAKEFFHADVEKWRIYYPTEREKERHANRFGVARCPFFTPCLHNMEIAHNLASRQPQTKVVLALREPVQRLFSQWKWEVFRGGGARTQSLPFMKSFSEYAARALDAYPEYPMFTVCGFQPIQASIYWKAVAYWIECFGRENVLVLDVGRYFQEPQAFLAQIHSFVGLPVFETPRATQRVNENPLSFPPPEADTVDRLRMFFEPHNRKLWQVIDAEFRW